MRKGKIKIKIVTFILAMVLLLSISFMTVSAGGPYNKDIKYNSIKVATAHMAWASNNYSAATVLYGSPATWVNVEVNVTIKNSYTGTSWKITDVRGDASYICLTWPSAFTLGANEYISDVKSIHGAVTGQTTLGTANLP